MTTDNEFLQPQALAAFQAEAKAFPAVLDEFVAAVSALTDLDDEDQMQRRDEAAAELQLALARLNSTEFDFSDEMSFWPADDDEGYDYDDDDDEDDEDDEDEGDEAGDDAAGEVDPDAHLSVITRVDLSVRDVRALKARAMSSLMVDDELTIQEADEFSDSPLQAAQALLPDFAELLEDAVSDFADVAWLYAGVSAGEFEREEDGFEDILEDEDHRAFYVEIFETEEEARAAAEAAGVEYDDEDGGPVYGGDSADGTDGGGATDGGGGGD